MTDKKKIYLAIGLIGILFLITLWTIFSNQFVNSEEGSLTNSPVSGQ